MEKNKISIYQIVLMALMAALTCVLAPNSLPIGPVPISLTNLVIYFSVFILGPWYGTGSYCIYFLLGIVGLPVFSNYEGGLGKIAGPTGGYIVGFILMALIGGICIKLSKRNLIVTMLGWVVGTLVAYAFGTVWFVKVLGCTYQYALGMCVYPFILLDLIKIVLGTLLGKSVYLALKKAGLLEKLELAK